MGHISTSDKPKWAEPMLGQQLIGAEWQSGSGPAAASFSPIDGSECWTGALASFAQADAAVEAAMSAFKTWSRHELAQRVAIAHAFAAQVDARRHELAELISRETGKPLWESQAEVATAITKVANSIDAQQARRWTTHETLGELNAVIRYKPHGVMLVLGPFNLPAHLPGAHIVPALLAGNSVIFKPSELTPAVGQWLVQAWQAAGLPPGVLNLIHGQAEIAQHLAVDDRVAGVLFTGSYRAGASLHKLLGGRPEKLLALEMGGNNPLVVDQVSDLGGAVMQIIESAYITSGQRCTCARRLILTERSQPERLLAMLTAAIGAMRIGLPFDQPQPYMSTLISARAVEHMMEVQSQWHHQGAVSLVEMQRTERSPASITPGLIDTTGLTMPDQEHFGPLLSVQRTADLTEAIDVANATRFGLSAGLLADSPEEYVQFVQNIRAGIVNWNRQTTGASGRLPFGGVGASGNHMPSGFFAADYCAYPVASLEAARTPCTTSKFSPGLEGAAHACSSN